MKAPERILVEAGAGCGKTTSIVQKFLQALETKKNNGNGYLPEHCILLTFTDASAREMRVRLKTQKPTGLSINKAYVGTFHSYCLNLLASANLIESQAKILSEEELSILIKDEFIKRVSEKQGIDEILSYLSPKELLERVLKISAKPKEVEETFKDLENTWKHFSDDLKRKLNGLSLEDISKTDWPHQTLKLLEKELNAKISFSTKKILKEIATKNPSLSLGAKRLKSLQNKGIFTPLLNLFSREKEIFEYLDKTLKEIRSSLSEYLTFSEIEKRCLKGLIEKKIRPPLLSLIIVDEFQDTSPEQWEIITLLSNTETDWYLVGDPKQSIYAFRKADIRLYQELKKSLDIKQLSTNYRSSREVLAATNKLQELIFNTKEDPAAQVLSAGKDISSPPDAVKIHEFETWNQHLILDCIKHRNSQVSDKNHAVLFREWKKLYEFADYLISENIPFEIQGSENYLDHFLSHHFALAIHQTSQTESSIDCLNFFYQYCELNNPSRWPQGAEWAASLERLLIDFKSKGILSWQKVTKLLYTNSAPSISLQKLQNPSHQNKIVLLTIHGSKGLEFDFVYLPDPRERISSKDSSDEEDIPFKYSINAQVKSKSLYHELQKVDKSFKEEAEQKRLFYVAITRAKIGMDFFLNKHIPNSKMDEPQWWEIWRGNETLNRFKWSHALRKMSEPLVKFVEVPQTEELLVDENVFFKPKALASSIKLLHPQKKAPSLNSEEQEWGTQFHSLLELWNGSSRHLDELLQASQQNFREDFKTLALQLKKSQALNLYWEALDLKNGWKVFREQALLSLIEEEEKLKIADVLMLKKDKAMIIDWKTSQNEETLLSPQRFNSIKNQVQSYADSLKPKITDTQILVVGIFRDSLQIKTYNL